MPTAASRQSDTPSSSGCLSDEARSESRSPARKVETAIERAPDVAEFYRTRANIRANLRQTGGLADDVRRFELLAHHLPRTLWDPLCEESGRSPNSSSRESLFQGTFDLVVRLGSPASQPGPDGSIGQADPGEFKARAGLATAIRQAGELDLAETEFAKVLSIQPDHIGVRMTCATLAITAGRVDDALPHLKAIIHDPGLGDYVRNEPSIFTHEHDPNHRSLIELLHDASRRCCVSGRIDEGRAIARRAVDLAIELGQPRGMSHYNLARACADSAAFGKKYVEQAAHQLYCAFVANPLYKNKYEDDPTFDPVRSSVDALLDRRPDPSKEYHRRLVGMSTTRAH